MTIEIHIKDTVYVHDNFDSVITEITRVVKAWYESNDNEPLVITLNKVEDRGPPVLKIRVKDIINVKSLLR